MPKYEVFFISKLSKCIGTIEAATKDEAIQLAIEGDTYQGIGGPCHHCADNLGDAEDGEFVAHKVK